MMSGKAVAAVVRRKKLRRLSGGRGVFTCAITMINAGRKCRQHIEIGGQHVAVAALGDSLKRQGKCKFKFFLEGSFFCRMKKSRQPQCKSLQKFFPKNQSIWKAVSGRHNRCFHPFVRSVRVSNENLVILANYASFIRLYD